MYIEITRIHNQIQKIMLIQLADIISIYEGPAVTKENIEGLDRYTLDNSRAIIECSKKNIHVLETIEEIREAFKKMNIYLKIKASTLD